MSRTLSDVKNVISKLDNTSKHYFNNLKPSDLEKIACVYVIYDDKNALYIGRTTNLRQRLYTNHLQGNKSTARLKKYIVEDNFRFPNIDDYNKAKEYLKSKCYFRYIAEDDSRLRGHLEGLLGYMLDSVYIEDEHKGEK
ncbi:MAG: GIY-YIG nuclease family protein [Clostridium sp.]|uniref:GIY-YIG nuclease family protein n=1 Tax=Clostridium sp. TaxID=1506 RepID=UPI002A90AB5E|nr:GIY-YIG nuclease family protein [Clostridium sp.]MDY6228050.1 GIY-YIG nuclease family protein [Clostridium sp.]